MARISGYHWDKFPSIQKLAKNVSDELWFENVNSEIMKMVKSGKTTIA